MALHKKVSAQRYSAPWIRRGGRDLKKNVAKPPCWERTGWFVQLPIIGGLNQQSLMLRAIALALRARLREAIVASQNLLDRAATLLVQGGEFTPTDFPADSFALCPGRLGRRGRAG